MHVPARVANHRDVRAKTVAAPIAASSTGRGVDPHDAGAEATVVLGPGSRLSDAQTARLVRSVAVLKAKKTALCAGLSRDELALYSWRVEPQSL